MSTYQMTKKPFWTSLLVIVHLLAVLLPATARPVSAQGLTCEASRAQAASALTMTVAAADEKVTIPKETLEKALQTTLWSQRYKYADGIRGAFLTQFMIVGNQTLGELNIVSPETQQEFFNRLESAFPSTEQAFLEGPPLDDYVHTMFEVALGMPELQKWVPFVWNRWHEHLYKQAEGRPNSDSAYVGASVDRYLLADRLQELTYQIVTKAYDCSQISPEFAEAYDQLNNPDRISSILDSADKILADNPDLPIPTAIRDGVGDNGTIEISLNDLKGLSQVEFNKVHETIDEMKDTLTEIDEQQDEIIDYLKNQELVAKHQALVKKKAEQSQLKLDAAKASITIITAIAGQIDPKVAKQINVVGNSVLQVGQAVNGWLKAVAGLKTLDKIASLSTVVMTGNVLGAVMNIVSLFGPSEPPVEQVILEEIGKLRQQVDQLRLEMHDRFDRIDQGLNLIYSSMHERFDQINIQLGKIDGNIQEVQQTLFSLDLQLSRIERNNFELLNALGRRPLLEAINGGLGYGERTGEQMPYQPDFTSFENTLHSWATIHAFDPVNAGPTQRDYSDGQLLAELSAFPLDSNINYLNGWMMAHGLPAISNKPLPSPRDWLFATRAYTQLGIEWPEHMKRIDPQRQAQLEQIGIDLEGAMQNLSTQLTQAGPAGNSLLFSTVMTNYQGKLDLMDSALQSLESTYVNEVRADILKRSEPFNLYGGLDQPISYLAPEITNATCGNLPGYGSLATPSNLRALIPNFNHFNLAEYLRLGTLSVCVSDLWYDLQEICIEPDPEFPDDPARCYYTTARHISYVGVAFDKVPIASMSIDEGELAIPPTGPDEKFTRNFWNIYKGMFEGLSALDEPTPEMVAQRAAVSAEVEAALGNYQQALYGRVLNEMSKGGLKPLATELGGSKALVDALTTLGLPRAVQQDEFLHALLFGDQQLVDEKQVMNSYSLRLAQPITGTNLLVNPRLVMQQADERTEVFRGMVDEYLAAITAKTHVETPDYIASNRRMFDLTMQIVRIEQPQGQGDEAIAGLQASGDSPTELGNATSFVASVTAGTNVGYTWDFGDGGVGAGPNVSHKYTEPGTYVVKVTARNGVSETSMEMQMVVVPVGSGQATTHVRLPLIKR